MTKRNQLSLIDDFFNHALPHRAFFDLDTIFDNMTQLAKYSAIPYNIVRTSDNTWVLELAVAGYAKEDLKISLLDNTLKIEGKRNDYAGNADNYIYEHKGITAKNFVLPINWAEGLKVGNATLENGMLRIVVERTESPIKTIPILDAALEAISPKKEEVAKEDEKVEINKVA